MSERTLSSRFLHHFVQALGSELGQENLATVLTKAGLPPDWSDPLRWGSLSDTTAAEAYAGLQKAMRTYYGRGARGFLIRAGGNLWNRLLDDAPLASKAQVKLLRGLPVNARRKAALELLAKMLSAKRGDVTVHTLEVDLLLVDHASPSTIGQNESTCICYVTHGLLRECLFWATSQEHDIEETSCRARGEDTCEFKITVGG
jgi:predicted hydrocarbon binding protein